MTDDTTTTDREEAARAGLTQVCQLFPDWACSSYKCGGTGEDDCPAQAMYATILADIEEGKRKDATIERLRKAVKAGAEWFNFYGSACNLMHADYCSAVESLRAALKEATDEAPAPPLWDTGIERLTIRPDANK